MTDFEQKHFKEPGLDEAGVTMQTISTLVTVCPAPGKVEYPQNRPLTTKLEYSVCDPLAITLSLIDGGAEPVVWKFGRDLMSEGLTNVNGVGAGDVRLRPVVRENATNESWAIAGDVQEALGKQTADYSVVVEMQFESPEGAARLYVPYEAMDRVLSESNDMVPNGDYENTLVRAATDEFINSVLSEQR